MKKKFVWIVLAALLVGCGNTKEVSIDVQLTSIANSKAKWELQDGQYKLKNGETAHLKNVFYAISDLDSDGNLEVIVSGYNSDMHSASVTEIYEYVGKNRMKKWNTSNFAVYSVSPNLLLQGEIQGIEDSENVTIPVYDGTNGERKLFVTSYNAGNTLFYFDVDVANNSLVTKCIATRWIDNDGNYEYYDDNDEKISEEELNALITKEYDGFTGRKLKFSWFQEVTLDNIQKSYSEFSIN